MGVTIHREAHFNAAHRLFRAEWSDEKNAAVFGKCSNPNYHGHNYRLLVSISGEIDPETGFVMDMKQLKELIVKYVEDYLDHKNLNLDVCEFKELNPTLENIIVVIYNRLRPHIAVDKKLSIKLWETRHNSATYSE
ncbi:MAG: 6-carboxytetrahydropterin synthase [Flavobacteriaceae bacterium]|jgi:6-pyruvoyltetrahydropterin/6-carboxytetrahydropterin synthase|nr:6-carboxytetrahydropterin synthase [Flavobacteriaceae bacterium]NVJ71973.1 6-carboxytetrahydropterin synthase [Flavobacteriaceae bacterium]